MKKTTQQRLLEAQQMKLMLIENFKAAQADYMEAIKDTEELILTLQRELVKGNVLRSNTIKYGRINIY